VVGINSRGEACMRAPVPDLLTSQWGNCLIVPHERSDPLPSPGLGVRGGDDRAGRRQPAGGAAACGCKEPWDPAVRGVLTHLIAQTGIPGGRVKYTCPHRNPLISIWIEE